ncbi:MAG: sugar transferase [Phycisphaerae bacterium]
MSAQFGTTVGTSATAHVVHEDTTPHSTTPFQAVEPVARRLVRVVGRCFLEVPTSSWLLVDMVILLAAIWQGYKYFPPPYIELTPHIVLWRAYAVFAFSFLVASHVLGLYARETLQSRSRILTRTFWTVAVAGIAAYTIIYVVMYATVSRRVAALALGAWFVCGCMLRLIACWAIHRVPRGLVVVGARSLFESFQQAQRDGLLSEYTLVGYAKPRREQNRDRNDPFDLGCILDHLDRVGPHCVTDIVVGDVVTRDPDAMQWLAPSLQRGCRVTNEAVFYEKATGQILVDQLSPSWFLLADLKVHCDRHATVQRAVDLLTAAIGLCVTIGLWPVIALAIKVGDGGSVFYSQDRVGQNGRVFRLLKFRTMRVDAENGKSVWASPNDPRVTPVGRVLRKSRLDELPQLLNVLRGDMSVVGPRPERPDIVEQLRDRIPFYDQRHLVKPGITGWAQISYRYGASIEDARRKLQFDLYYLKHMSFELDTMIVLRTLGTFLKGAC